MDLCVVMCWARERVVQAEEIGEHRQAQDRVLRPSMGQRGEHLQGTLKSEACAGDFLSGPVGHSLSCRPAPALRLLVRDSGTAVSQLLILTTPA